jgi:hypothetical protein
MLSVRLDMSALRLLCPHVARSKCIRAAGYLDTKRRRLRGRHVTIAWRAD